ncbi:hypothetical protein F511_21325 [Dorcoceras hygrometricum]|uniref:Dystroglycan-like n=1 Tax=Dorcoceras hygrometricum TaxID=472368 RepID=A0A2Z7CSL6_9LAMI|nr:hypothetical protein F511_21325 [Dorcoceras hygrometricum]
MASSLISNTVHILFDSVLAMDEEGIVAIFEDIVACLKGFLGCPTVIYEAALIEFFQHGSVRDGMVVSTIQGKTVEITEEVFAGMFELPIDGLTDLNEVLMDLVFDARSIFSFTGEQVSTSCKKREMKIEFRLLSDILAKPIFVKARSLDAVTHERFLMMVAINGGVNINWSRALINIFKDMVTPGSKQARGYVVQICCLLKKVHDFELVELKAFPPLKILTEKTINSYIAINDKISGEDVEGVADESRVKKIPMKKAVSKKRPATAVEEHMSKKKRTRVGKAAKNIDFLVQLREKVIADVVSFFHSFSLSKLGDLELVKVIISKEKQFLAWAEMDSLETAVRRREFTIAKYREMLLRKFLESHRQHFQVGQPSTETDLQIIALLSNAHIFAVETLQTQMRIHGLQWEIICSSRLFEGTDVHMILSESSSSNSGSAHLNPTVFASISQRPLDIDLTSPNPSTTDSRVFFTTDDTPVVVDQILMPTAVTPLDFTEPLAQLRALFNQISTERVQMRNDSKKLKDMLLMEISRLEKNVTEMLIQQDSLYRGLFNNMRQEIQIHKFDLSVEILASQRKPITQQATIATGLDDIRKDVDETKAALSNALLEFHAQAQEN